MLYIQNLGFNNWYKIGIAKGKKNLDERMKKGSCANPLLTLVETFPLSYEDAEFIEASVLAELDSYRIIKYYSGKKSECLSCSLGLIETTIEKYIASL